MGLDQVVVTVDMLRNTDIESVIAECQKDTTRDYHSLFNKKAMDAKDSGTGEEQAVFCFLSGITSMYLRPADTHNPFGPMFVLEDCRTALVDDFLPESLNALAEYCGEIPCHELKARVADVLWLRLRNREFAEVAINAYIESAKLLEDPEKWTFCAERIERALRLAHLFRRQKQDIFDFVIDHISKVLVKYDGEDPLFLSIKLIGLLSDFYRGDFEGYFSRIIKIATDARQKGDFHKAEQAWDVAAKLAQRMNDNNKRHSVYKDMAETLYERALAGDGGLGSSMWARKAVEAYRNVPQSRARIDEIYQKLRQYQRQSLSQMTSASTPGMDIREIVFQAENSVKGMSLEDAMFQLAFLTSSIPKYEDLKNEAAENSQTFLSDLIFSTVHIDKDGLLVATSPANLGANNDQDDLALWKKILLSVRIHHQICVQGSIEPARMQMLLEHRITEEFLYRYISKNPFIPNGHEFIFAKGLCAGFHGDFLIAGNLLIPQLENSFRHVLQQRGVETTTMNPASGLQERWGLSTILEHPEFEACFGKNMSLDLQALLVERQYSNLRNSIAHGIMHAGEFYQPPVVYMWWLTLRLCLTPFFTEWKEYISQEDDMALPS